MKKILTLILIGLFLVFGMLSFAQEKEEMKMADPAEELAKSIANGKMLFGDKSLGTGTMTCNSCHMEGGTKDGKMGDKMIPAFDNVASKYPKYFKMAQKVMTLSQVNNWCLVNTPMKGKALAWDDQKLADLTAYVASVKAMKEEKKK